MTNTQLQNAIAAAHIAKQAAATLHARKELLTATTAALETAHAAYTTAQSQLSADRLEHERASDSLRRMNQALAEAQGKAAEAASRVASMQNAAQTYALQAETLARQIGQDKANLGVAESGLKAAQLAQKAAQIALQEAEATTPQTTADAIDAILLLSTNNN